MRASAILEGGRTRPIFDYVNFWDAELNQKNKIPKSSEKKKDKQMSDWAIATLFLYFHWRVQITLALASFTC